MNSSQENLDSAQQRLQKVCKFNYSQKLTYNILNFYIKSILGTKLGYTSVVIRQINNYLPENEKYLSLLPYAKLLFSHEDPNYMCQIIKKLSPIRLYLYGNKLCSLSEWSRLMIETEIDVMDDEDNWIAFLENEYVENEVKWNFAFMYAREWKVSRIAPLDFNQLDDNPRFQSALRRAHITFAEREIEVTAQIYDWYTNCIERGYLQIEVRTYKSFVFILLFCLFLFLNRIN